MIVRPDREYTDGQIITFDEDDKEFFIDLIKQFFIELEAWHEKEQEKK